MREQLLTAAVTLIETDGVDALSLRRLARDAGVSPRASYHHIANRSALLAALSVQGYELLRQDLRRAWGQAGTGAGALAAVVRAYVRFAQEHPGYVHLMLRPELSEPQQHPEVTHAGQESVQLLTEIVRDCQREGTAPPGDPTPLVAMVWALAVGIVTLWLDGPLEDSCADLGITPETLTTRITAQLESLLVGWASSAGR